MVLDFALDGSIFIDNVVDAALQEIDIIFNTTNTELIGNSTFGTNFEMFLWQLTPSPASLKSYISDKLTDTYWCQYLNVEVNVEVVPGEVRNIYYVQIILKDDAGHKGQRIYEFK